VADLVFQDRVFRSRTRIALSGLADPSVTGVRLAVAYTTRGGCESLVDLLRRGMGRRRWSAATKVLITSFDFYLTEPRALDLARREGFEVYRGLSLGFAFHPKLFVLDTAAGGARMLVGSANLTDAALDDNTEFGLTLHVSAGSRELKALNDAWDRLLDTARLLGPTDIRKYHTDRARNAPRRRPTPRRPTPPRPRVPGRLPRFADEVAAGRLLPGRFRTFWIQAGAMPSSDSHNQLELPRFANNFFGFSFRAHAATPHQHALGTVRVTMGSRHWPAQQLNWRGTPAGARGLNRMERIYLPTLRDGGVDYVDTAIRFTRKRRGLFDMLVVPWGGATARSWQQASARRGTLFSVGRGSTRICGFL
jgi:HKD family nuclease